MLEWLSGWSELTSDQSTANSKNEPTLLEFCIAPNGGYKG